MGGTTYKVRVRALNKHGWSNWSSVVNVRAATKPSSSITITTTNSSTSIVISWTQPYNSGLDITAYYIAIKRKIAGSWISTV